MQKLLIRSVIIDLNKYILDGSKFKKEAISNIFQILDQRLQKLVQIYRD